MASKFFRLNKKWQKCFSLAKVTCDVINTYDWQQFSFVYQSEDNGACSYFNRDFDTVINARSDCIINFKDIYTKNDAEFTVQQIKLKSRIVVLCFDDDESLRTFALKLFDNKMYSADYVYLIPDSDMSKSGKFLLFLNSIFHRFQAGLEGAPFWFGKFFFQ